MKRIVVCTLILGGFLAPRCGATVYHSNGTAESVRFFHDNQAQNGDTITLPAGTFIWTTGIVISKAITLQGAGVGSTIIRDGVQSAQLIRWSLPAGVSSRLTGIEFQAGGRINIGAAPSGILHVDGSNTNGSTFRWDHCKWNNLNGEPVFDTVIGVVDHNAFIVNGYKTAIYIYDSRWNGQDYGDGSWAAPIGFGSSEFLFIEDNTFTDTVNTTFPITDAHAGARFVVRHNSITNGFVTNHGTESTGRVRGCRAIEVYNNTFTGTNLNKFVGGSRSGGALFHDNRISGYWGNNATLTLNNYRNVYPFNPWGGADGTNVRDVNNPNVFFMGTAPSNSSGTSVTVSGANWSANQWVGYTLRRTSDVCNSNSITYAWITGNSSNTITWADAGFGNMAICAGDSLEIRKVNHSLDQPGRGQGTLLVGWNNQVTEPCYSWNNVTNLGGHVNFAVSFGSIRANEHYFNDTPMPGYTPYVYPHPLVTGDPIPTSTPPPPSVTICSQLQQRLDRLQRRRQRLQQSHRSNQKLNGRIRKLQRQLQSQHCS